jgi:hypothetical protein
VTERLSCEKPVAQDANFILSSSKMSRVVIPNFSNTLVRFRGRFWSGFQKLGMGFLQLGKGNLSEFNRQLYDCFQFLI